jgi:hypothetical protein
MMAAQRIKWQHDISPFEINTRLAFVNSQLHKPLGHNIFCKLRAEQYLRRSGRGHKGVKGRLPQILQSKE